MRLVLAMLLVPVSVALVPLGVVFVLIGAAEQRHAENAYVVGFVPGAGCDDDHELYLSVKDGEHMDCVPAGGFASGRVHLPGFTDAQNDQVDTLAEELGGDGLSAPDQREIQSLVDRLAPTVPPDRRLYHDQALWGTGRIRLGAGMIVIGVLGVPGGYWLGRSWALANPTKRRERPDGEPVG
ncbi:hypothetical protein [Amycolatopsis sp. NPDC057786]|uniref:hypothetical protein n=1 Tax=Amycolatopsis sp. NPDC057786 TaxID=3346250 RepID=UPI0036706E8C